MRMKRVAGYSAADGKVICNGSGKYHSCMHAQGAEEERHNLQQRFVEAAGKSAGLESQLRQLEARWVDCLFP